MPRLISSHPACIDFSKMNEWLSKGTLALKSHIVAFNLNILLKNNDNNNNNNNNNNKSINK